MRYQINSAQLFLTYPQCPLTKERVFELLSNKFKIVDYIVAHELHTNGDDHIHVYLKLEGPLRSDNPGFADLEGGYHGNYQGCRSSKNVIKYCTKEEDYLSNLNISDILSKKGSRKEHFTDLINRKRTLDELITDNPQYLINYNSLSNALQGYFSSITKADEHLPMFLPNPWGKILPVYSENRKRRHYHIYSSGPNAGKTTWANTLRSYGTSIVSNKEHYWNVESYHRIIVLDEFNTARVRYDELNAMADGNYCYRRFSRGVYQFLPGNKPIIIILSNQHLYDLYPHTHELLYARYKEIDVSSYKFT